MGIRADLDKKTHEARFYFRLVAEPRWKDFQYQNPIFCSARDDTGKTHSPDEKINRLPHWNQSRGNVVDFTQDWAAIKVAPVARTVSAISSLSFEVPIRIVHTRQECRFTEKEVGASASKVVGDRTFTLKKLGFEGRAVQATVFLPGAKNMVWGSFEFRLEQDGKKIGVVYPRMSSASPQGIEYRLEGNISGRRKPDSPCELVISFPGETSERKFRFDFRNVKLPYPMTSL